MLLSKDANSLKLTVKGWNPSNYFYNLALPNSNSSGGMKGNNKFICGGHLLNAGSCYSRIYWIYSHNSIGTNTQRAVWNTFYYDKVDSTINKF